MRKLKVLFYLEPVEYSDNPMRLDGWRHFFTQFALRSTADFDSFLAASHTLASRAGDDFIDVVSINPTEFLGSVGFDRRRYSRNLCSSKPPSNDPLVDALVAIRDRINPDVVISPSENAYLKKVFGASRVMFTELGPLPRSGMKPSIHLDPFGHQTGSALDRLTQHCWPIEKFEDFRDVWETIWAAPTRETAELNGLGDWFRSELGNRPALLVVLQPADWITYEGTGPDIDPVSLLRKVAFEAPRGWVVVPQWHPSDVEPLDTLVTDIMHNQSNIRVPPKHLRCGHAEEAIHHATAAVTISSNVAAVAAINGVAVQVLGQSKFRCLANDPGSKVRRRFDLLAFLAGRYCSPLDDWLLQDGCFAEKLLCLMADPNSLFDPTDIDPARLSDYRMT